jgi:hypothetical protein
MNCIYAAVGWPKRFHEPVADRVLIRPVTPGLKASQHQFEVCTIYHDIIAMRIFIEVIKYDLKIPVFQMAAHTQHAWMDVFRRKAFDHGRIFGEKHRMHEGGTVRPAEIARQDVPQTPVHFRGGMGSAPRIA